MCDKIFFRLFSLLWVNWGYGSCNEPGQFVLIHRSTLYPLLQAYSLSLMYVGEPVLYPLMLDQPLCQVRDDFGSLGNWYTWIQQD